VSHADMHLQVRILSDFLLCLQIQIGRMTARLLQIRGSRIVVTVPKNADAGCVLSAACAKYVAHDRAFCSTLKWTLRYPDGTEVHRLPEGDDLFTLAEYRCQLLKDYQKIVLFISSDGKY